VQRAGRKFFDCDLPEALDSAQQVYSTAVDEVAHAVSKFAQHSKETSHQVAGLQDLAVQTGEQVDGSGMVLSAMAIISAIRGEAPAHEVLYIGPDGQGDSTSNKMFDLQDKDSVQSLGRKRGDLEFTTQRMASDMGKETKVLNGIEKLYENYLQNPSFGSADDVFADLYEQRRKVRNLQTLIQRNQGVIGALQKSNVDAISLNKTCISPPLEGVGSATNSMYAEEEDWDDEGENKDISGGESTSTITSSDKLPARAIALYDYIPAKADEIAFNAGDIIKITAHDSAWWTGSTGGAHGLFPATYVQGFAGNWDSQVLTLYSYDASKPDELSVAEDEVLTLLTPQEDGWAVVLREATGEQGLVPLSYLNQSFANNPNPPPEVQSPPEASTVPAVGIDADSGALSEEAASSQSTDALSSSRVADALADAFGDLDDDEDAVTSEPVGETQKKGEYFEVEGMDGEGVPAVAPPPPSVDQKPVFTNVTDDVGGTTSAESSVDPVVDESAEVALGPEPDLDARGLPLPKSLKKESERGSRTVLI